MKVKWNYSKLIDLAKANNGIVKTSQVVEARIAKDCLQQAVSDGVFEKVSRGIYSLAEEIPDTEYALQLAKPKVIYSHSTSAYFNRLTTRDPIVYTVTVPQKYNATNLIKAGYKVYYASDKNYDLGITTCKTMFGNQIKIYDAERTLCDLFSARYDGDLYIQLESLKNYLRYGKKNINKLMTYAEQLGVQEKLRENSAAMFEAMSL